MPGFKQTGQAGTGMGRGQGTGMGRGQGRGNCMNSAPGAGQRRGLANKGPFSGGRRRSGQCFRNPANNQAQQESGNTPTNQSENQE